MQRTAKGDIPTFSECFADKRQFSFPAGEVYREIINWRVIERGFNRWWYVGCAGERGGRGGVHIEVVLVTADLIENGRRSDDILCGRALRRQRLGLGALEKGSYTVHGRELVEGG